MNKEYLKNYSQFILILLIFLFESVLAQSSNVSLIGRWANGPCYAVTTRGDIAYFGNGCNLEIVDFDDPANPVKKRENSFPCLCLWCSSIWQLCICSE